MLRSLKRLIGFGANQLQLLLELDPRPRDADDLRRRLVGEGLAQHYTLRLTDNRTVVVSFTDRELRIHRGYLDAPDAVLRSVVAFVQGQSRASRSAARRELLAFRLPRSAEPSPRSRRAAERTDPADDGLARRLARHHAELNEKKFGGELTALPVRVSRRMRSRLGHYMWRGHDGEGAEIVISRRHIRRHGWDEAVNTLLHEMVHQWQDERGLRVDHGREFRRKARAVGIAAKARRDVA